MDRDGLYFYRIHWSCRPTSKQEDIRKTHPPSWGSWLPLSLLCRCLISQSAAGRAVTSWAQPSSLFFLALGIRAYNDNSACRPMPDIPGWRSYRTGSKYLQYGCCGWIFGYYVNTVIRLFVQGRKGLFIGSFTAAWCSLVLSATCCAVELSISGTAPLKIVLPAMAGIHAVIGIGEGFITIATLSMLTRVRPDLLELQKI